MDASAKPLIFISCGQRTDEEKHLGREIIRLIEEQGLFEPYFAEFQSDLEGVTNNIFKKLNEAVGFITVMHSRGRVNDGSQQGERGSIWIEQEIAIASFLAHTTQRKFSALSFVQEGIQLEGVREYILLNSHRFRTEHDILDKVTEIIPTWSSFAAQRSPKNALKKVDKFRKEFLNKIRTDRSPLNFKGDAKVALHLIPISSITEDLTLAIQPGWETALHPMCSSGWNHDVNRYGVYTHYTINGRAIAYTQLYKKKGVIEAVYSTYLDEGNNNTVQLSSIESNIVNVLSSYLKLMQGYKITPPIYICLSLLDIKNKQLFGYQLYPGAKKNVNIEYQETDLELQPVEVKNYEEDVYVLIKPIFDELWNTAGFPKSPNFAENGQWKIMNS